MNKAVVDSRIYQESIETLKTLGFELIKMPKCLFFDDPISAHPDMSMVKVNSKWFINSAIHNVFTFFSDRELCLLFDEKSSNLINCDEIKLKYPKDIALNCLVMGDKLFCNSKNLHENVRNYAEKCGIDIIDVKQGYAKCSCAKVSETAVITEDEGMAKALSKNGIDVLLINKGYVRLDGYDCGFIGGASGLIKNNLLAFNGKITAHPDCQLIYSFCKKNGVEVVELCQKPLYDVGSILVI